MKTYKTPPDYNEVLLWMKVHADEYIDPMVGEIDLDLIVLDAAKHFDYDITYDIIPEMFYICAKDTHITLLGNSYDNY